MRSARLFFTPAIFIKLAHFYRKFRKLRSRLKHQVILDIFFFQGPDYSLIISSVRWYDSGRYFLKVDGVVVVETELTVNASHQAETSIGAPTFLSRPEPRTIQGINHQNFFMLILIIVAF